MASKIVFEDNSIKVKDAISSQINIALEEVSGDIEAQVKRNFDDADRVDTGKTKNSFRHVVDDSNHVATVGSSDKNAIWEEFGTGEYALQGNGRKGGWYYVDEKGNGHFTHGKKPSRALWNAYNSLKSKIVKHLQDVMKGL